MSGENGGNQSETGNEAQAHQQIFPITLRQEFQDKRAVLDLETTLGFVLMSDEWDGVPSRDVIGLGLEKVAQYAISTDMQIAAAFLKTLAAAFREQTSDGWRAQIKGKQGGKRTRNENAKRAARLIQIGLFYHERYAELGPGCSRAAETDAATKFRCAKGDVSKGRKELLKAERLYDEVQRLVGDPIQMSIRLRAAENERIKWRKSKG